MTVAAIVSVPSSVPSEHGVPFFTKDKGRPSASKGASPKEPTIHMPLEPREEVVKSIRSRRTCYRFFRILCDPRARCPR